MSEIMQMKVFRMNDCDWVCAESEKQAKEFYHEFTEEDKEDIEENFEGEVSLQDTMFFKVDDLPQEEQLITQKMESYGGELFVRKTFKEVIEMEKITKPCIICSTEY